jgi:hypothetical protein
MRRMAATEAITRAMQSELSPDLTREQVSAALRDIPAAADLQARRQEWAAGQLPESYKHRLPFIHAHTVLYALDNIGKSLGRLTEIDGLPAAVTVARDDYQASLPDLVDVRDSAHHTEDRARGLDRRGRPLILQPVYNRLANAPGGFIGLSNLNGNKLGYTTSSGRYCEIEISAKSVEAGQVAVQHVLDALSWRGPTRSVPS